MTKKEKEIFERMAEAQEQIAGILKKQQPGVITQVVTTGAAIATALSVVFIIESIIKWVVG